MQDKKLDEQQRVKELALSAKRGDAAAFEQLVKQFKGLVRVTANSYYLADGDHDDLLQEGMLGLFVAINDYDETKGAFPSFAELCVKRRVLDAVRQSETVKLKRLSQTDDVAYSLVELSEAENIADDGQGPLESLLSKERLRACLNALTVMERTVFTMFLQGYSYEDISQAVGKSVKSVDGALQRARKKLADLR